MEKSKTHYRRVFKSDHLGVADLEDFIEAKKRLVFTIKEVKSYVLEVGDDKSGIVVAGKRISANIAYFQEEVKPLVLNATNSKIVKKLVGSSFVEDWKGVVIELYVDKNVKMKGEFIEGVRIKPNTPTVIKPELTPTHKRWEDAKSAVLRDGSTIETIRIHWTITQANYDLLCG